MTAVRRARWWAMFVRVVRDHFPLPSTDRLEFRSCLLRPLLALALLLTACSSSDPANLCAALIATPTGCPPGRPYAYLCSSPGDGEPTQPDGAECTELPSTGGAVWCCPSPE